MLKRVLLGAILGQIVVMPAGAADLGIAGPPVLRGTVSEVEYVTDWSGAYLGAAVGAQFVRNWGFHGDARGRANANFPDYAYDYSRTQFSYGIFGGYQRQFGNIVVGGEVDIDGPTSRIESALIFGNPAYAGGVGGNTYIQRLRSNWQGSARARLGYASAHTLLYITAGVAFGNFTHCAVIDDCNGNNGHIIKYNATRIGWTAGAGIEHRLSHAWTLRAEYRYTNFGSKNCNNTPDCAFAVPANGVRNASDLDNRVESHAVRLGLSYYFGGHLGASHGVVPGPVHARY